MGKPFPAEGEAARRLAGAIDDALQIARGRATDGPSVPVAPAAPESLLSQCLALCAEARSARPEPLRVLHQFACTGGTLVSRCISAMPNVQLLSEVDPLSTMQIIQGEMRFAPTDVIQLLHQSSRGASQEQIIAVFNAAMEVLMSDCGERGQRLVIRDHAHSKYCCGSAVADRPSVRKLLSARFDLRSAVIVRHPLDSFLSLRNNGWLTFDPRTINEYGARYLAFLDDHAGIPISKYEAFVADPAFEAGRLCEQIEIPFDDGFLDRFDMFRLTGDSGRTGPVILPRARRAVDAALAQEIEAAPHFQSLLQRLDYPQ